MGLVFLERERKSEAIASLMKAQELYTAASNVQGVAKVQEILEEINAEKEPKDKNSKRKKSDDKKSEDKESQSQES